MDMGTLSRTFEVKTLKKKDRPVFLRPCLRGKHKSGHTWVKKTLMSWALGKEKIWTSTFRIHRGAGFLAGWKESTVQVLQQHRNGLVEVGIFDAISSIGSFLERHADVLRTFLEFYSIL